MLFADRLEVWNPGQLPPSLTPEALRSPHASIPHNPLIAEPLFLTRYVEKAGTGILDMISLCEAAELTTPEFRQEGGQFIQTLWRPKGGMTAQAGAIPRPSEAQVEAQEAQVEAQEAQVEAQEAQVEAQDAQVELPTTDVALLTACAPQPRSGQELLLAAGYTKRTGNFKRSMDRLLGAGFLEMSIPEKPTSRVQRYRLTDKGLAWLANATKAERP
jgi:ATP-dependent DNA helicase RecG